MVVPAGGAELEPSRHEPDADPPSADGSVRGNLIKSRLRFSEIGLDADLPAFRHFLPRLGVILGRPAEREVAVGRLGHQEAPTPSTQVRIVIGFDGDVVDLPFLEADLSSALGLKHRMMFLTALATEVGREQQLLGVFGIVNLSVESHRPHTGRIEGRVQPPGPADQLVQTEREEWSIEATVDAAVAFAQAVSEKRLPQRSFAGLDGNAAVVREQSLGLVQGHRPCPLRLDVDIPEAESRLHPDRQRISGKISIRSPSVSPRFGRSLHSVAEASESLARRPRRIRDALERLRDHIVNSDRGAEDPRGDIGDRALALVLILGARHRRRRSDCNRRSFRRADSRLQPAHQQGNVSALAATIGVQFVQDNELKPPAILQNLLVELVLPSHEQFEHHEVCEQNIGGAVADLLTILARFLSGVASKTDRSIVAKKLPKLLSLAVGERIHGVNDNRSRSHGGITPFGFQNCVDDGNEEAERLARTGARRHYVAFARKCDLDRLSLMPMQLQRRIGVVRYPIRRTEYGRRFGTDPGLPDKLTETPAARVVRIDLDQRRWPEASAAISLINLFPDFRRPNGDEGSRESFVLANQRSAQVEDVHGAFLSRQMFCRVLHSDESEKSPRGAWWFRSLCLTIGRTPEYQDRSRRRS